jgi:catechol 2,3-dioxygenase-like lactoylglutathione lyase family enzyme
MLDKFKMVGFVGTSDYDKAREFYVDKLGLAFVSLDQFALVVRAGQQTIRITKLPNFKPQQGTTLGWEVKNIAEIAKWLRSRGVAPEIFPFAQDKDLGIWTAPSGDKVAWFKDPDGSILGISEHITAR